MSTIPSASPRPSLSSLRTSTSTAEPATERGAARRNKAAALRDYYGLRSGQTTTDTPPRVSLDTENESEIDRPAFSAQVYVERLLKEQDLAGVLKVEATLVKEVWGLDGEKKALVYDNYSKLIGATETIRSMRERMETRRMETSTLAPAIGHIAETASALSAELFNQPVRDEPLDAERAAAKQSQQSRQATVRWVLNGPARMRSLVQEGKGVEAEQEWSSIAPLLDQWKGVKGVEEIRKQCLATLESAQGG